MQKVYRLVHPLFVRGCRFRYLPLLTLLIFFGAALPGACAADADGDGLPDDWEVQYGYDPADPADAAVDTDGDGLSTVEEYLLSTNPLLSDTDGDSVDDGTEVVSGMNPLAEALQGYGYAYEYKILEDAEDGDTSGWSIWDNDPPGSVEIVEDPDRPGNHLIHLNAPSSDTGFGFALNPREANRLKLEWRMRVSGYFMIQVGLETTAGWRSLQYDPTHTDFTRPTSVLIALGTDVNQGEWVTIRRDLQADLSVGQPGVEIIRVADIKFRLPGYLDDMRLYAYADSDRDLVPDTVETAVGTDPADGSDAHVDSDEDGIGNLAEIIAGTDARSCDTDGDGLSDSQEGDFSTDPLDPDTDEDGVHDGSEVLSGMDPLTRAVQSYGYAYDVRVLEDAEDGDTTGWSIWDNDPPGSVETVEDPDDPANNLVHLNASSSDTGFGFALDPREADLFKLEWRMKVSGYFMVQVGLETTAGWRSLQYDPTHTDFTRATSVLIALGTEVNQGEWATIRRDLQADLSLGQPGVEIVRIANIKFRLPGYLDDIQVYGYLDRDRDLVPDTVESAVGTDPDDPSDADADGDGDGIGNREEIIAGTDATDPDTDHDGLSDSDELTAGTDPVNPDTDGDGVADGTEIISGMDPLTPALQGDGFAYECRVIEDAEDGDTAGWDIWDNDPPGTVDIVEDPDISGNHLIHLNSPDFNTGFRYSLSPREPGLLKLQWSMRVSGYFMVQVGVETTAGWRSLQYDPTHTDFTRDTSVLIALGTDVNRGEWVTIRRDLQADLSLGQPGVKILRVADIKFRLPGYLDDIRLYAYPDLDRDLVPDSIETAGGTDPADPTDAPGDADRDCLDNISELILQTDPLSADTDADGMPDAAEVHMGTDPFDPADRGEYVSAPAAPPTEPGVAVAHYEGRWTSLPRFENLPHYAALTVPALDFTDGTGPIAGSVREGGLGSVFTGFINVPEETWYEFRLTNDDGARFALDGTLLIDADGYVSHGAPPMINSEGRPLAAGMHSFRIDYIQTWDDRALLLEWRRPGSPWFTPVPASVLAHDPLWLSAMTETADADGDGLLDAAESQAGTGVRNPDSDGDGLSDGDEVHVYGTDPLTADTDGDGVTDHDEVVNAHTDPLVTDFDGSFADLHRVTGDSGAAVVGTWDFMDGGGVCRDRQGSAAYILNAPAAGHFAVALSGTQDNALTEQSLFLIEAAVDGVPVGRCTLSAPAGTVGVCRFFTPLIAPGNHSVTFRWINGESDTFLKITSVALQQVGSPDTDEDGIADWVEHRLEEHFLKEVPSTVFVSPFCLEGTAAIPELVSVRSTFVPEGSENSVDAQGLLIGTPRRGTGNSWYADIPLAPGELTDIVVASDGGAAVTEESLTWMPTNLLDVEAVTLRRGDSLLLAAHPGYAWGNTNNGDSPDADAVLIEVEGNVFETTPAGRIPYRFENAGELVITTVLRPESNNPLVRITTVDVVSGAFNGRPALIVGSQRFWDSPGMPAEALLEWDGHLRIDEMPVQGEGRMLDMITYVNKPGHIVARLGADGPVLASTAVDVLTYDSSAETQFVVVRQYSDGSELIEGRITLSVVPDDLEIHMHIFAGGVTFEDGTIDKVFTADDFSDTGELRYRFIRAEGGYTAACHYALFYQNGFLIKPW